MTEEEKAAEAEELLDPPNKRCEACLFVRVAISHENGFSSVLGDDFRRSINDLRIEFFCTHISNSMDKMGVLRSAGDYCNYWRPQKHG